VTYLNEPQKFFIHRMRDVTYGCGPPYVAVCPDDDFLAQRGLERGVELLDSEPECMAVRGRFVTFPKEVPTQCFPRYAPSVQSNEVRGETALDRLRHLSTGAVIPALYAIHRTASFGRALDLCGDTRNLFATEITVDIMTALGGQVRNVEEFFCAREERATSSDHVVERFQTWIGARSAEVVDWIARLERAVEAAAGAEAIPVLHAVLEFYCASSEPPARRQTFVSRSKRVLLERAPAPLRQLYREVATRVYAARDHRLTRHLPGYPWSVQDLRGGDEWRRMRSVIRRVDVSAYD
jgi:glycosyltransferase domain-containing protein